MIKLNGVEIKLDKYPDGTFLFKNIPSSIGGWHSSVIEWFFDSMEEFAAVVYIARYCWDHKVMPYLYMPYIPDARMDRVKKENEIFTTTRRRCCSESWKSWSFAGISSPKS